MKNKLLNFIDLLIFFFNQGYSLQETLDFCSLLNYEKEVKEIKNYLNQGLSLDEIFIMLPFPTLFKEYYSFFKNEFTLETALKKSIEICKKRYEYKNIFLKNWHIQLYCLFSYLFFLFLLFFTYYHRLKFYLTILIFKNHLLFNVYLYYYMQFLFF